MKKFIKSILVIFMIFVSLVPSVAFGSDNDQTEWQDIVLSEEEFDAILANNTQNSISTYSSNLIESYSIAVSKSSGKLVIAGKTIGNTKVVKCGFTKVVIQRRKNSSSSWSSYKTYEDLYSNSRSYRLSKSISVKSGYQYRVTCTHYAKKNLLSTQKINNTSNTVKF